MFVVPVAMAGYPLSIGPIIWLAERGLLPKQCMEAVDVVYAPIGYVLAQSDEVTDVFDCYCGLWFLPPDP